jgi:hypothetical protein
VVQLDHNNGSGPEKRKWGVRGDKQRQGDGMGYLGGGKQYSWISNGGRW